MKGVWTCRSLSAEGLRLSVVCYSEPSAILWFLQAGFWSAQDSGKSVEKMFRTIYAHSAVTS